MLDRNYRLIVEGEFVEAELPGLLQRVNGLGWSPDGKTMYLVDSGPHVVHAFAFDPNPGTISKGRVIVIVDEDVGAPDGMTVDAAGDLWVAIYGGGRIQQHSSDGELRQVIAVPAKQTHVLRVRGGGTQPSLRHHSNRELERRAASQRAAAGLVYWCHTDSTGLPAAPFRPDGHSWQKVTR